jgi:hypothetical protein
MWTLLACAPSDEVAVVAPRTLDQAAEVRPAVEATSSVAPAEPPPAAPAPPPEPPAPPPKPRKPRAPAGALPTADALPTLADTGGYAGLVAAIEADRKIFARYDEDEAARAYLRDAITRHLFPAWKGTPWAFYGATNVPGEGAIACGYWVASVLRDVGFRIDRDHVGKQASEKILLTFTGADTLRHFGSRPVEEVIARVRRLGEGLWGVGLANHAGFVWNDGTQVYFCHSNYTGVQGPMCEEAEHSWPFRTSYTVIGSVLGDPTVGAWLEGRRLPTGKFGSEGG